jgi:hypothetical protein
MSTDSTPVRTPDNADGKRDKHGMVSAVVRNDVIGKNFQRFVAGQKGMKRYRAGFKTLRAMARTMMIGAGVDPDLVAAVMGRRFRYPVDDYYIRGDLRSELVKLSGHIHGQLFPTSGKAPETKSKKPKRKNG